MMTTPSQNQNPNPRFWEQLAFVNETAPESIRQAVIGERDVAGAGPFGAQEDSGIAPDYAYLKQHILVRKGDEDDVRDEIARVDPQRVDPARQFLPEVQLAGDPAPERAGVARLHIGVGRDVHETLEGLKSFNERRGRIMATPDYLIGIAADDGVGICPADEPVPAGPMPIPAVRGDNAGDGVRILVVDTGLITDVVHAHPWMTGVDGDERKRTPAPDEGLRLYYGHGTFIAGILKCVAPGAEVRVSNELSEWVGAELTSRLGGLILEALDLHYTQQDKPWPDIISLSAGTSTLDNEQLLGFQSFFAELGKPEHSHTVLVAAAGNDGRDRPFWPAAYAGSYPQPIPGVVSVGALRQDGQGRACFSNYGDWVKVFAPGERLVSVFPKGRYKYVHSHLTECRYYKDEPLYPRCTCISEYQQYEEAYFDGMAQWSGTSYSTPFVAGLIAARKSQFGGTARQAAEVLMRSTMPVTDVSSFLPGPVPEKM
jgi:subtilisin family serine protease